MGGKTIIVGGEKINLIDQADISGDIAITHDGVTSIGNEKVTAAMIDTTLLGYILPVAVIGVGQIGYCKIG